MKHRVMGILSLFLLLSLLFSFAACGTPESPGTEGTGTEGRETEAGHDAGKPDASGFSVTAKDGTSLTAENGVFTVTAGGEYTLSGEMRNGQVRVSAGGKDVTLTLDGAAIFCDFDAPLLILDAESVTLKAEKGTHNRVTDERRAGVGRGDAAVFAETDLSLSGKGTLTVTAAKTGGIHAKGDLDVKNLTLDVTSAGDALRGNDSVTVESGKLTLRSQTGDGIKTSDSDLSSRGKARGNVTIEGGNVILYAARDGMDAARDVSILGGSLSVFTSVYADDGEAPAYTEFFLLVPEDSLGGFRYAAYFYDGDRGVFEDAVFAKTVTGGKSRYAGLRVRSPEEFRNVTFYRFQKDAENSLTEYDAKSEGSVHNTEMNAFLCDRIRNGEITGDYLMLEGDETGSATVSAKGIKAAGGISVSGGAVSVLSKDDAIHANGDVLESGETGSGNVTITGGSVTLASGDDAVHAERVFTVSGGLLTVTRAHEGVEANVLNFDGGEVSIFATDDGLNAERGTGIPLISVTDGVLRVETAAGDTDGIDANGNYRQTGGFVLVLGGSPAGVVSGSMEVKGRITVTGGTTVALGGICELPEAGSANCAVLREAEFPAGAYQLTAPDGTVLAAWTQGGTFRAGWIACDGMVAGERVSLLFDGEAFASWVQESGTTEIR